MPLYVFNCSTCQHREELIRSVKKAPRTPRTCSKCKGEMERDFRTTQFAIFKEYTEDRITDEPIRITSPQQRDALMKKHRLTYDPVTSLNRPQTSVTDSLTFDEVADEAQRNPAEPIREVFRGRVAEGVVDTGPQE